MRTGLLGILLGCLLMHMFAVFIGMTSLADAVTAFVWQASALGAVWILEIARGKE